MHISTVAITVYNAIAVEMRALTATEIQLACAKWGHTMTSKVVEAAVDELVRRRLVVRGSDRFDVADQQRRVITGRDRNVPPKDPEWGWRGWVVGTPPFLKPLEDAIKESR